MRIRKTIIANLDSSLPYNAYLNTNVEDMAGESWLPMHGSDYDKSRPLPKVRKSAGVLYAVSSYGRIKKIGPSGEKIIAQSLNKNEKLPKFEIGEKTYFTQEIVAKTYEIRNDLMLPELGHVNGVPWDNRPENLEYCEVNSDVIVLPYTTCNFELIPTHANYDPICKVTEDGQRLSAFENAKPYGDIRCKQIGFTYMKLREYIRTPKFRKQAAFIMNVNNKKHPWLL